MTDKFTMPQNENVFLANRIIVDLIYKSANLEGIAVTFADTVNILNDVNVDKLKPSEITKVFCLRNAWHFLLDDITAPVHLGYLEQLHEIVARADVEPSELGQLRRNDVLISGTNWRPELPNADKLHNELQGILKIENATDKALTAMLWLMRCQMFKDGNKRVATLLANKILIENGNGIISIPVELDAQFKTMLVDFYVSGDMNTLKEWLYENCIDGIQYENELETER